MGMFFEDSVIRPILVLGKKLEEENFHISETELEAGLNSLQDMLVKEATRSGGSMHLDCQLLDEWWRGFESTQTQNRNTLVVLNYINAYLESRPLEILWDAEPHEATVIILGRRFWDDPFPEDYDALLEAPGGLRKSDNPVELRASQHARFPRLREIPRDALIACSPETEPYLKTSFNVGLCGFSSSSKTLFSPTNVRDDRTLGFRGTKIEPLDHRREEINECVSWAIRERVAILCFPELSMCDESVDYLLEAVEKQGFGALRLIIAGSWHRLSGDDIGNIARVFEVEATGLRELGRTSKTEMYSGTISEVEKADPAFAELFGMRSNSHEFGISEDAVPCGESIFLTSFGLISVPICKDSLTSTWIARNQRFSVDTWFSIAMNYSSKVEWHLGEPSGYHIGLFVVNAHQASFREKGHARNMPSPAAASILAGWKLPIRGRRSQEWFGWGEPEVSDVSKCLSEECSPAWAQDGRIICAIELDRLLSEN